MKIKIKHKKPLSVPYEGKWRTHDTDIHFYVYKEESNSWLRAEISSKARTLLLDTIVYNPNVKGRVTEDGNTLIYEIDIDMSIQYNEQFLFIDIKETEEVKAKVPN